MRDDLLKVAAATPKDQSRRSGIQHRRDHKDHPCRQEMNGASLLVFSELAVSAAIHAGTCFCSSHSAGRNPVRVSSCRIEKATENGMDMVVAVGCPLVDGA